MTALEQVILTTHIAAGSVALLLGAGALAMRKGGRRHRGFGRWFWRMMVLVLMSAVAALPFRNNAFLASLAVFAAYMTFSGVRVLRRRRGAEPTAIDWIASALALVLGIGLSLLALANPPAQGATTVVAVLGGVALYATYDLVNFRARLFARWPNAWLYEHIWKMVGAYTSVVSAFSGSVLQLFEPPWRQLWPSMVGTPALLILVFYYRARLARGAALPGVRVPAGDRAAQLSRAPSRHAVTDIM